MNGGKTLKFLSPFLWLRLLLRCEGNAGNSFRITQGKDSSSRVETGMLGIFMSCSKGVKDPLEVPEVRCD